MRSGQHKRLGNHRRRALGFILLKAAITCYLLLATLAPAELGNASYRNIASGMLKVEGTHYTKVN